MSNRTAKSLVGVLAGLLAVVLVGVGVYFAIWGSRWNQQGLAPQDDWRLHKTDASLLGYTEIDPIRPGLDDLRAVAIGKDDRVYVGGDQAVLAYSADAALLWRSAVPATPTALAADATDTLLVAMSDSVQTIGPDHKPSATWSFGRGAILTSIAIAGDSIYLADSGLSAILRCDRQGKVLSRLGQADPARNIPGILLRNPHFDVAVGKDGLVWANNPGRHQVEAYTPQGERELAWGEMSMRIEGFADCCNPRDIALLADGRVVTSEKGLPRVKVYDSQGNLQCVVAGSGQFAENDIGMDVAADSKGRILVVDPAARTVRIFVPKPTR